MFLLLLSLQTTGSFPPRDHKRRRTASQVGRNLSVQEACPHPPRPLGEGLCPPWDTCAGQRGGPPPEASWVTWRHPEAWRRTTWTTGAGVRTSCVSVRSQSPCWQTLLVPLSEVGSNKVQFLRCCTEVDYTGISSILEYFFF